MMKWRAQARRARGVGSFIFASRVCRKRLACLAYNSREVLMNHASEETQTYLALMSTGFD
jgi:hypothetical protein